MATLSVRRVLPILFLSACFMWLLGLTPPTASAESCTAKRKPGWKADEVKVWAALCRREKLDFQSRQGTLRGAFLREILSAPLSSAWDYRLEVSHVVVEGKTDLSGLEVSHEIRVLDSTFKGAIDGSHSNFRRNVCLQGSDLLGLVDFSESSFDGGLYLGNEADEYRCGPEPSALIHNVPRRRIFQLSLESVRARGDIYIRDFITDSFIKAALAESEKSIFFWYCSAAGINLAYAQTAGQINIVDCSIRNSNRTYEDCAIDLNFSHAKNGIFLTRSKLFGPARVSFVDCSLVNIRGTQLQSLELGEAVVSKSLELGAVIDPGAREPAITRWMPIKGSLLNLRNAKVGSLVLTLEQDETGVAQIWPESIASFGFRYEQFYGGIPNLRGGHQHPAPIPTSLSYGTYIGFLSRQQPFSETPYRFLGNLLVNSGEDSTGKHILYAGRVANRGENIRRASRFDPTAYAAWFGSFMLDVTIGYGYYMHRVVFWILFLTALGAQVFRSSPEARQHKMPYGLAYSFDMLLPVVQLRKLHSQIELRGWRRYYFYFQKISGYVLAVFVAAGLSGITK